MTVRSEIKKKNWRSGQRQTIEMRPFSLYLPAVRDRILKKALIHEKPQINHSGSIFQMKPCWEYDSLNSDHSTGWMPLFIPSLSSVYWSEIILGNVIFYRVWTKQNAVQWWVYVFILLSKQNIIIILELHDYGQNHKCRLFTSIAIVTVK